MGSFHYKQCWTTSNIIDISPFLKTQKSSILYSIILKVNNSGAAKVEYLTKKIIKNIKIQLPAISTHVRLPRSFISMTTKTIYKSVVFCAIGEVFATGCFTFNYRQRYARKDNSVLTPRYWFPILFSLSVVLKYKLPVPVSIFFSLKTARFCNLYFRATDREKRIGNK